MLECVGASITPFSPGRPSLAYGKRLQTAVQDLKGDTRQMRAQHMAAPCDYLSDEEEMPGTHNFGRAASMHVTQL
jgi:hypothetical protein